MQIDVHNETLVTFADLAKTLPRKRRGRPVHVSTVHRWRQSGLKGVRLEAVRIGGAWCTSREAFARFCARLTAAADEPEPTANKRPAGRGTNASPDDELEQNGW